MTFGQLIFWIIVAIIAYYAYSKYNVNILIIAIAILVLYYLVGFFTRPTPQIIIPAGTRIEGYYGGEHFAPIDHNVDVKMPPSFDRHTATARAMSDSKYFDVDEKLVG